MSGQKVVVDVSGGPGKAVTTLVDLTADELAQRAIDDSAHTALLAKQADMAQIPTQDVLFTMLWNAVLTGDLSQIKATQAVMDTMAAKYPAQEAVATPYASNEVSQ